MKNWQDLPEVMKNSSVKSYYDHIEKKHVSLFFKRLLDLILSIMLIVVLLPMMILIGLVIKVDSKGPILYVQDRLTRYHQSFAMYKFRSMTQDSSGLQLTKAGDMRITHVGKFLRKYRLDELPQLFNILKGDMSFVGTRPEVKRYVDAYTDEMYATFLLPAGLTSKASIAFADEGELLDVSNPEEVYIHVILPKKMAINLDYLTNFSILNDLKVMVMTPIRMLRR